MQIYPFREMPLRTSIWGLNAVLRSSGHPQKAMYATIATVVINTILDPVFIYGFGWGIRGAAVATIVAQIISLTWQFKLFGNKDELLHFHRGDIPSET